MNKILFYQLIEVISLFLYKIFQKWPKNKFYACFLEVLAGFEKEMGVFNLKTCKTFQNVKQSSNERGACEVELIQPPKSAILRWVSGLGAYTGTGFKGFWVQIYAQNGWG